MATVESMVELTASELQLSLSVWTLRATSPRLAPALLSAVATKRGFIPESME